VKRIETQMSPGGQSMLAKLVSSARGPLEHLISKVVSGLGTATANIKPVLDEIVKKLNGRHHPLSERTRT
jgi:hypothetical protein